MGVRLDHTIVRCHHKRECAVFLASVFGLAAPTDFGEFLRVEDENGTCLDYHDTDDVSYQHYAFLVGDEEFDALLARMEALGLEYYTQGHHRRPHEITTRNGGRAIYLTDPDDNSIEVVTRHYVPEAARG